MDPTDRVIKGFYYTMLSFVHHLIAICEFKLELQSENG